MGSISKVPRSIATHTRKPSAGYTPMVKLPVVLQGFSVSVVRDLDSAVASAIQPVDSARVASVEPHARTIGQKPLNHVQLRVSSATFLKAIIDG